MSAISVVLYYLLLLIVVFRSYNIKIIKRLKVAYNKIFHSFMGLRHWTKISENLIKSRLDPIKVIIKKLIC